MKRGAPNSPGEEAMAPFQWVNPTFTGSSGISQTRKSTIRWGNSQKNSMSYCISIRWTRTVKTVLVHIVRFLLTPGLSRVLVMRRVLHPHISSTWIHSGADKQKDKDPTISSTPRFQSGDTPEFIQVPIRWRTRTSLSHLPPDFNRVIHLNSFRWHLSPIIDNPHFHSPELGLPWPSI